MNGDDHGPVSAVTDVSFARMMRRIEDLVHQIESGPDPHTRDLARELTRALLALHREGLAKVWACLEHSGDASRLHREACLDDPLVSNLLALHDLHPVEVEVRVAQALDRIRPRLRSHGGDVVLLGVKGDTAHLRLVGHCDGCPSSARTMHDLVENGLCETAADITTVVWDNDNAAHPAPFAKGYVPLENLGSE